MREKLRNGRGETLVETLFAMLMVTFAVLMVATAAVAAARINRRSAEQDSAFHRAEAPSGTVQVSVAEGSGTIWSGEAELYLAGNGLGEYRYYFLPGKAGTP